MKKAYKLTITGTVQGVFFRQFIKEQADLLNLKGYVRNLENTDVEVYIEGEQTNIEKYAEIVKKGPPHAQIRNIQVEEKKWSGDVKDFRILRI